ncbi:MAG: Glycine hydroxymethyltransferase, partial [Bacteroidota bacterium]|nr:Glycine hydroxymethyltransferase [Bacteroidota bacterium]
MQEYIRTTPLEKLDAGSVAYIANLQKIAEVAPQIAKAIIQELKDQRSNLKLIASENYSSLSVQLSMGNLLTDKYSEGYAHHRFYPGCSNVDEIEDLACAEAVKLFGCDHAYVQPHSGADANLIAFWSILRTKIQVPLLDKVGEKDLLKLKKEDWDQLRINLGNQKLLAMDLFSGGHLTHGYRHNVSAQMFDAYHYGVNESTGLIDYEELHHLLKTIKPLIFLAGYSAYTRKIDFELLRQFADEVNAVLMVDMAHFAGLVAGKVFEGKFNPIPYAHIVTSTTHKTLRGPRGGLILCKGEFAESVDKGCPMVMGGPLPHVMAAKAIAFIEANNEDFKLYAHKIVANSNALAQACQMNGMKLISGGTDNHLLLIDVRPYGLTGRQAEGALRECGITLNRNTIPNDTNGPWYTSGLRLGTPAVTTLGMESEQMIEIANFVKEILENTKPDIVKKGKDAGELSKALHVTDDAVKEKVQSGIKRLLH